MKVYMRVHGDLSGVLFREGNYDHAEALIDGKWIEAVGWRNHELKYPQFFRLVGNNFKLK